MPFYDYECTKCGKVFEAQQTFEEHDRHQDHDQHKTLRCPNCGNTKLEQCITPVNVVTSKKS